MNSVELIAGIKKFLQSNNLTVGSNYHVGAAFLSFEFRFNNHDSIDRDDIEQWPMTLTKKFQLAGFDVPDVISLFDSSQFKNPTFYVSVKHNENIGTTPFTDNHLEREFKKFYHSKAA